MEQQRLTAKSSKTPNARGARNAPPTVESKDLVHVTSGLRKERSNPKASQGSRLTSSHNAKSTLEMPLYGAKTG